MLKNLKTSDSSYFRGKNYFSDDDTQNYLVLQPIIKYFEIFKNILTYVSSWQSKGLSNEVIKPPTTYKNGLAPKLLIDDNDKLYLEFKGSCLKRDKSKFIFIETENIYSIPVNAVNISLFMK